jgi:transcriptional regulator with XRE-family HTH domain
MVDRRHPPNRLLSWERLQRGWSYAEVADRIRAEMLRTGEVDTGLTANTVRRWETGERWPDPRYRKHVIAIFGKPATELGLLTPEELDLRPEAEMVAEFRRLYEIMTGEVESGISRSTVLRGLLGVGALPVLNSLLGLPPEGAPDTPQHTGDPATYATITACHRKMYWIGSARPLFEAAYAHTQLGLDLVRGSTGTTKTQFATALAESALLTARLAFFDLGRPAVADRCFDVALSATREAGDHSLAAAVLGHMAFVPIFGRDPEHARSLLKAAHQHTWHGVHPSVRAWLHCTTSEGEARAGASTDSRHHIDLAATALGMADTADTEKPAWLDFIDPGRLHSFAGYAALTGGDNVEAAVQLTSALDLLGPEAGKQRSVVLADLAACHPRDDELQADYLNRALDALELEWYETGLKRVRDVRPELGDSQLGRQLDERIDTLTPTRRQSWL